jgi:hypothetical protein
MSDNAGLGGGTRNTRSSRDERRALPKSRLGPPGSSHADRALSVSFDTSFSFSSFRLPVSCRGSHPRGDESCTPLPGLPESFCDYVWLGLALAAGNFPAPLEKEDVLPDIHGSQVVSGGLRTVPEHWGFDVSCCRRRRRRRGLFSPHGLSLWYQRRESEQRRRCVEDK